MLFTSTALIQIVLTKMWFWSFGPGSGEGGGGGGGGGGESGGVLPYT